MRPPRWHLFELEDLTFCPRIIRDYGTDYLHWAQSRFRLHRLMVDRVEEALEASGQLHIVDLCSGGGGPTPDIVAELRARGRQASATLTDRFPSERAAASLRDSDGGEHCHYHLDPVDARRVPPSLIGVRTIANAFHHFAPADARQVLRSAVDAHLPIVILETPDRRWSVVLATFLAPVAMMLATPWIRPFRWTRLLWTYVVPVVPFLCLWDGVVSQLRAYTAEELEALGRSVAPDQYEWRAGQTRAPGVPVRVTYLVGLPRPGTDRAGSAGSDATGSTGS